MRVVHIIRTRPDKRGKTPGQTLCGVSIPVDARHAKPWRFTQFVGNCTCTRCLSKIDR